MKPVKQKGVPLFREPYIPYHYWESPVIGSWNNLIFRKQLRPERCFLREEKSTSRRRANCVVLRVSKADWLKANLSDIVELIWVPTVEIKPMKGYVRYHAVFAQKNRVIQEATAFDINRFTAPRFLPDSTTRYGASILLSWLQGDCFSCQHRAHGELLNKEPVIRHLEIIAESNRQIRSEREAKIAAELTEAQRNAPGWIWY